MSDIWEYGLRVHYDWKKQCWKEYRIISIVELLKSSDLNLNNCEVIQENLEVMLVDSLQ
jgi:hypothetical protein